MEINPKDLHMCRAQGKDTDLCQTLLMVEERHSLTDLINHKIEIRKKSGGKSIMLPLEKVYLRTHGGHHFFCLLGIEHGIEVEAIIFWEDQDDDDAERVVGQMMLPK